MNINLSRHTMVYPISGNFIDLSESGYGARIFKTNAPRTWSDDFSSGVLSPRYVTGGGTWSIEGGVLVNTLTTANGGLGAELITGWTNNSSYLYDTLTVNGKDITSAIDLDGAIDIAYKDIGAVVANNWYKYDINVTLNSGAAPLLTAAKFSGGQPPLNLAITQLINGDNIGAYRIIVGRSAEYVMIYNTAAGNWSSVNSLKKITIPALFNTLRMATPRVLASVGMTRAAAGTPQGLVICLDDPTNPLNYILCRTDGAGNLIVEKIINGVTAPVLTHAYTYSAGKVAYIDASALPTVKYGYDGVEFGSGTVSDPEIIGNRYHGVFGTASGAAEGSFSALSMVCS